MSEQQAAGQPAEAPVTDVVIKDWDTAGLEDEGPVQFVIEDGKIAEFVSKEKGTRRIVAQMTFKLVARPGRKLEPAPTFFDNFNVDAQWIRRFKALVKATKTKVSGTGDVSIAEIVRSLKGKTAAGIIEADDYIDKKTNEKVEKRQFGHRFAPTLAELTAR